MARIRTGTATPLLAHWDGTATGTARAAGPDLDGSYGPPSVRPWRRTG